MSYESRLYTLIEEIKADKSFPNPWRNYVGSDGVRLQALIRMGENTSHVQPPQGISNVDMGMDSNNNGKPVTGHFTGISRPISSDPLNCNCPEDAVRRSCPVHGVTA